MPVGGLITWYLPVDIDILKEKEKKTIEFGTTTTSNKWKS
jgi:hypothetical protein